MALPSKPYVGPAPILNEVPASSDWGQLVRPIGTIDVAIVPPSTSTVAKVPLDVTTVTLMAANTKRLGLLVYNDSNTALCLKIGAGADIDDYTVRICAGAYWEAPFPVTIELVTGVWVFAGTGSARVTELATP